MMRRRRAKPAAFKQRKPIDEIEHSSSEAMAAAQILKFTQKYARRGNEFAVTKG
jgi:hypothetical protein